MKRTVFLTGFLASFTISTGFAFKIMHWPYATILMLLGFVMLNVVFLPLFFYHRYKAVA